MAKGFLGIEVSLSKLHFVYVEKAGRNLVVKKTGSRTLPVDMKTPGTFSRQLKAILSEEKISVRGLWVTINRKEAPISHKKFPSLPPKELQETVEGDIEKIPLFFDRDFDFVYQSTDIDKQRCEVTVAAADQNLLDSIIKESQQAEVPLRGIDIAPLNLPCCFPELIKEGAKLVYLIVNENSSSLIIHNGKRFEMVYNIGVGTADLFESKSVEVRMAAYDNWIKELKRVIRSYLVTAKDEAVQEIRLVWDSEHHVDSLEDKLSTELPIKVQTLKIESLKNVRVTGDAPFNSIYFLALAPVACVLRKIKPHFAQDYFLRSVRVKRFLHKSIAATAILVVALIGICVTNYTYYSAQKEYTQWKIDALNEKIAVLEKQAQPLRLQEAQYQEVMENLFKQATFVKMLNRVPWSMVLGSVASELPNDLALTSFKFFETGNATFAAETFQMETIAEFLRRIDESKVLENGKFDYLREEQKNKQKVLAFGIQAQLKGLQDEDTDH